MSLFIRGGTVVNHDHSRRADVLIQSGTIVAVGTAIEPPLSAEVIDADGCYVLPGGIDPHTHLELGFMGTVSADDFEWGTKAGLSGGTTMVVDFCIPDPGQSMLAAYQDWRRKSEKAAADYGFHMAVTSWSKQVFDEMEVVVKTYGINTFKHFMAYKGALMVNDDELYNSFARCAALGAMPLVHAENGDVVARMQEAILARGIDGPEGHAFSRPPEVEGEATSRAIMIADMTGAPLYVVHTSCRQSHEAIARARAAGQRVYGEPLIQHLLLDDSEYRRDDWDHAAACVMSPPFRDRAHQDSLWAGLQSGSLQVVATDHCAFTLAQKRLGRGDFRRIPNGTGGLEDRMPLLWTAGVGTGRLTKEEFVAVTSANIARILNIFPRKGAIMAGSDADLVVWDPAAHKTIRASRQVSRIDYNVFEGFTCTGGPAMTVSRGRIAWRDGELRAQAGDGRYVERPAFPSVHVANSTWKEITAPRAVAREMVTP
ncbi:D-hydantoinase (Dihydropyrimidinase) (DHPase) [Bradyrhizobium sp. ORS 278]|uniref:dihydropyrimidinase n=1 Tax=Bradyrhizobium sp. (strain ORS 278) TaxID=114615 RepID=UPI00015087F5|nr:dihydropyrimidinase [Bradyrhizobium sp. ORS 278]CAL79813.1 D-hydantoinase (Dihydropyrimidinase) (DHPase) [Bradyrhizobium sp. ORS 278]